MFTKRSLQIIPIVLLTILFAACNNNSPKSVADKFLTSFYHMEYDKAREVATEDTKNLIDLVEQFSASTPDSAKQEARKIKIDIKDVQEQENEAVVTYSISSEPGEYKLNMVKENEEWLANFSKQNNMENMPDAEEEMAVPDTTDMEMSMTEGDTVTVD